MRRLLWLIPILLCVQAFGQVTFDAHGAGGAASGTGPLTFTHVTGALSNGGMILSCSFSVKTITAGTPTYNGTNMTFISGTDSHVSACSGAIESGTAYRTMMWSLAAPASGSHTVSIPWTGTTVSACGTVTASGVDQTTPANNGTCAIGTTGVPTVNISSNSGDLTMDDLSLESGAAATGATQTQRDNIRQSFTIGWADSTGPGIIGPITHAWGTQGSEWELSGANFKQASATNPGIIVLPKTAILPKAVTF